MKTKSIVLSIAIVTAVFSLGGCMSLNNSSGSDTIRNATQESINQKIIVGKSTKADVTRELGDPSSIVHYQNDGAVEQWAYLAADSKGSPLAGLPFVGMIKQDYTVSNHEITVSFNKRGIVTDVEVSSAKLKSHTGFL